MSLDYSQTSALLKQLFPVGSLAQLGLKDNTFFALTAKDTGAGGTEDKIPMTAAPVQAVSATFGDTQTVAAASSSTVRAFLQTLVRKYSTARITGMMVRASKSDQAAFVRALSFEIEQATRAAIRSLERQLFLDRVGYLGYIDGACSVTAKTITLKYPEMAHRFEVGMLVRAMAGNSGAFDQTPRTGSAYITGINRSAGTLTTTAANWDTSITSLANTDYLFPIGDYVNASDRLCVAGLLAWIPYALPSSDSFYGVDRSVDRNRLAGTPYDGSSDTVEEALINGQAEISANGGVPTRAFLSYVQMKRLINSLGSKVQYNTLMSVDNPSIGFRGVLIQGDRGPIEVLSSPFPERIYCHMIDPSVWRLRSAGEAIGILDEDGQMIQRVYNSDEYEVRIGGYLNLQCTDTSANGIIRLAA